MNNPKYTKLLNQVNDTLVLLEQTVKLDMTNDFKQVANDTGDILEFFSGMGVFGFEVNGEAVGQWSNGDFMDDDCENMNKYNDLFKKYEDIADKIENEFKYPFDFIVRKSDYITQTK